MTLPVIRGNQSKNYLLSYLQGYANSGLFASNGDDAIPVFKMNATDNTSDILDDTYALEVINLVNQERVAAGLDEPGHRRGVM